jgi:TatD DNase family protein
MFVDSHCHLDLIENTTPEQLLTAAKQNQVNHCLCVAIDLEHFPTLCALAERTDNVFISVGVHPNVEHSEDEPDVRTLVNLAAHPKVVAIGETGLDYYRSTGNLAWQHERFCTHIEAAKQTGKPLIIHTREAAADTIRLLREENAGEVGGVMHCFVEDWETAEQALNLGFYISFSGIVTFKNATALQAVAQRVPLDRLLIETDAPYLAPVPYRGKTNQPAYVKHVAEFLAKLRGESVDTVATATTANFFHLFKHAA